jgi:hypothetical protein
VSLIECPRTFEVSVLSPNSDIYLVDDPQEFHRELLGLIRRPRELTCSRAVASTLR